MRENSDSLYKNKKSTAIIVLTIIQAIILVLVLIAAGMYFFDKNSPSTPTTPIENITPTQPIVIETDTVAPVEEPIKPSDEQSDDLTNQIAPDIEDVEQPPLPTIEESDPFTLNIIEQLLATTEQSKLFAKQDIINNIVVFISNLSQGELLHKFSPVNKPSDKFTVIEDDGKLYLNPQSYRRYDSYITLMSHLDTDAVVTQYHLLSPLLEQVYGEVGHPQQTFKNALSDAIDILLAAPIIEEPIALIYPSVMYKFADEKLENLPAAQKLMIRMGPENSRKLKEKLRQVQSALANK
ncbi:DUF3014 domain-containing protein [Psychromonas sp. MME2]|uniref:DUF3014 domain-containing protein n=1 Tax=unclassified Psychromonas TaxID=2614957 RepID=UPI00339BAEF0